MMGARQIFEMSSSGSRRLDPLGRARTDQRFDLGFDLGSEGAFEAPFLAAEGSAAWGDCS